MDDAEASKAAGAKLLAACKKATDPARDLTGTPGEAAWLANGKVCPARPARWRARSSPTPIC